MIRRLNYTGRKRIPRSKVVVHLRQGDDGYEFDAEFDIDGYHFATDAKVFVEAYNAASYMRFDFGTVAAIVSPENTRLVDVTPRPLPRFRLKVVDVSQRYGLLLGVADQLVPLRLDEELAHKQSLLPVDFTDLEDRAWRLDLSDWPVLELNKRISMIGEAARSSGAFLGLVYPELVRTILTEILFVQEVTDPDFDDSAWTSLWLRYACSLPNVDAPPDGVSEQARAAQQEWIDTVVQVFCRSRQARQRLTVALAREFD